MHFLTWECVAVRGGETYHNTPPQKRFWTPHLWYVFPPISRFPILPLGQKGLSPEFRATRLWRGLKKKGPLWRFSAYFPVFKAHYNFKLSTQALHYMIFSQMPACPAPFCFELLDLHDMNCFRIDFKSPWPSFFPCVFRFPCFFRFPIFLAFLGVFPLFSKDFRGSAKRKTLAFLGKNPCFFQKSKDWRVRATTYPLYYINCDRTNFVIMSGCMVYNPLRETTLAAQLPRN